MGGHVNPIQLSLEKAKEHLAMLLSKGRWPEGESLAREILAIRPHDRLVLVTLGDILKNTDRFDEAISTYDKAIALHVGDALPFTKRATSLLRRHWGKPPAARTSRSGPRVSCLWLGTRGRFGNQLLQYGVTRLAAQKFGAEAHFPDWIGRDLFDLDDPFVTEILPALSEDDVDIPGVLAGRTHQSLAGYDLQGYFCQSTADYSDNRKAFIAFFQPGSRLATRMGAWQAQLGRERTVVALHLRRGDFGKNSRFWIAPEEWYLTWLSGIWPSLSSPVLYIATDDPAVLPAFSAYKPVTARDLGDPLPGAEFFCDFYALTQADWLAISNSTFSFVAAMLNVRGKNFYRPEKEQKTLVRFDPWNAQVLLTYPA